MVKNNNRRDSTKIIITFDNKNSAKKAFEQYNNQNIDGYIFKLDYKKKYEYNFNVSGDLWFVVNPTITRNVQ